MVKNTKVYINRGVIMQKFIVVRGNGDPKQTKEVDDLLSNGWKIVNMQSQPVDEGSPICFLLLEKEEK